MDNKSELSRGILQGIRVVDMGVFAVGPVAASFLGDLGADVIHVEQLGRGDPQRGVVYMENVSMQLAGNRNALFEVENRNKRSIALDAKKPEGKKVLYDLVKNSDVFCTNLRPNALTRLGLDYETLVKYQPKLIWALANGFGENGPSKNAASFDLLGQARSCTMTTMTNPDIPTVAPPGINDLATAFTLAYGVLAAIVARERYGIGQKVTTSQLGAGMNMLSVNIGLALLTGKEVIPQCRERVHNPLWNWYRCKDGRWIALGLWQQERHWGNFCDVLDMEHLEDDPRFNTPENRSENCEELIQILDKVFATRTCAEWERVAEENDLVVSRVNRPSDLVHDPQVMENDYIVNLDHPVLGQIWSVGHPIKYSKTPATYRTCAPEYGQHTEEVLIEVCGYDWDRINELRGAEII